MLSSFCCSMTCLKWLRLLNAPLKKSCVIFIIWKHLFGFLLDALFGLTWRMLTTCLTLTSRHKPLWSFGFWLVMPLYASFNVVLSLCMIMAVISLLVGHSKSFASLHFVLSMCRCSGYRGYPGPPAPEPLQRPSFSLGVERRPKPAEKTLMRRRLMRRTTTRTAKDQKTSSWAFAGEGRDHVHVSSTCLHAEQEDKGRRPCTAHATLNREETNFRHACIKRHSGCWPPP
jgi:hypothetical protein